MTIFENMPLPITDTTVTLYLQAALNLPPCIAIEIIEHQQSSSQSRERLCLLAIIRYVSKTLK